MGDGNEPDDRTSIPSGEDQAPFYKRLTFKFLFSIAMFILVIEAILLAGSIYGMEERITTIRNQIVETVNTRLVGNDTTLAPDSVFSSKDIREILVRYGRNVVVMVLLIMAVVLTGVYFILWKWVLSPLRTILDHNTQTSSDSIEFIPQDKIPNDEFGTIMDSRNEMLETLKDVFSEEAIETLVNAVDAKDRYTRGHSTRVGTISQELGKELKLPSDQVVKLKFSGNLHDVGKIGIADDILTKPEGLTDEEYAMIQEHPVRGEDMIRFSQFDRDILDGIRHHHEQYDGSGYPDGLEKTDIPLFGRILAVSDAVDAMLSTRHYRDALSISETHDQLQQYKNQQFDPKISDAALDLLQPKHAERLPDRTAEKLVV